MSVTEVGLMNQIAAEVGMTIRGPRGMTGPAGDTSGINVLTHGLYGTGAMDDSDALEALIAANPSGSAFLFPAGTYYLHAVSITKPIKIVCNGPVIFDGKDQSTILETNSDIEIVGIGFANCTYAIKLSGCDSDYAKVDMCDFSDVQYPVYCYTSAAEQTINRIIVRDCTMDGIYRGVYINNVHSNNVQINRNIMTDVDRDGIHLGDTVDIVKIAYIKNVNISGNDISNVHQATSGTDLEANAILVVANGVVISDNHITGITSVNATDCEAIYCKWCDHILINGNVIYDGGKQEGAITVKGGSDVSILDNAIYFNHTPTIALAYAGIMALCPSAVVKGNLIMGADIGIHAYDNTSFYARDNTIINSYYAIYQRNATVGTFVAVNNIIRSCSQAIRFGVNTATVERAIIKGNVIDGYVFGVYVDANMKQLSICENEFSVCTDGRAVNVKQLSSGNDMEIVISGNVSREVSGTDFRFYVASDASDYTIKLLRFANNTVLGGKYGVSSIRNYTKVVIVNNDFEGMTSGGKYMPGTVTTLVQKNNVGLVDA